MQHGTMKALHQDEMIEVNYIGNAKHSKINYIFSSQAVNSEQVEDTICKQRKYIVINDLKIYY